MKSESEQKLGCDTADMLMIHRLFRWLFGDAPGLVRGVAAGDTARAEVVGAHIEQIVAGLHPDTPALIARRDRGTMPA